MFTRMMAICTAVLLFVSVCAAARADVATDSATDTATAQVQVFALRICDAAKTGNMDFFSLLSLEFGIRLTLDEKQLKKSGQTIDQAVKQNEDMLRKIVESSGDASSKADKCAVDSATPMDCPELYKKIESISSPRVSYGKIEQSGKAMRFESCGVVAVTSVTNSADGPAEKKAEFAVAKMKDKWEIIMVLPPKVEKK